MTCAEFQRELPEYLEGGAPQLRDHLNMCPSCSGLVASLESISREARQLQASEEPSPRVWANIELTLRREGVIRDPHPALPVLQGRSAWAAMWRWMLPLTAGFLLTFGVLRNLPGLQALAP